MAPETNFEVATVLLDEVDAALIELREAIAELRRERETGEETPDDGRS